MKYFIDFLFSFLLAVYVSGQTQIGDDISGKAIAEIAGSAVCLSADGTRVAVGAPGDSPLGIMGGQARVYQLENDKWVQLGNDILGDAAGEKFGQSISLSADGVRVAIGAPFHDGDNGLVKVFEYTDNEWLQIGNAILGAAPFGVNQWGKAIDLSADGSRVVIGAPWTSGPNGSFAGYSAVFEFNGTDWTPVGAGISGENDDDFSGASVSISANGSRIAISSFRYDDQLNDVGAVRIFEFNGTEWTQVGSSILGSQEKEQSGFSIALSDDGNRLALSAPFNEDGGDNAGQLRVYDFNGINWVQVGQHINGLTGELSGWHISMSPDGSRVALGAQFNDDIANDAGAARIFGFDGVHWQLMGEIKGESENNTMGAAISFSENGGRVAVGAPSFQTAFPSDGLVRVFGDLILNDELIKQDKNEIIIYPNPTNGKVNIENIFSDNLIQLLNTSGEAVLQNINKKEIDISLLPNGLYFLILKNEETVFCKKLIKN